MTTKSDEALAKLIKNLIYNFTFVIPIEFIEDEKFINYVNSFGIENYAAFIDENINKFLIMTNSGVERFSFVEPERHINITRKHLQLQKNLSFLAKLKDKKGKASFSQTLELYIEYVIHLIFMSDEILENNRHQASLEEINIYKITKEQSLLFQSHSLDIERLFLKKGEKINQQEIIVRNIKRFHELPSLINNVRNIEENPNRQEIEFVGTVEIAEQFRIPIDKVVDSSQNLEMKKIVRKKIVKPLIEYFTHDKKEKILEIVKDKLGDINGKQLRFLIEYFIMQGILSFDNATEFHRQLKVFFDQHQIAVCNSIFAKKIFYPNDTKFKEKVTYFNNVFKDVLNPLDLYK